MELLNTISTSRLWTRHGLKIAYAIGALLVLVSLASIAWDIKSSSKIKTKNYAKQKIAPIKTATTAGYRINNVVKANLFGDPTPAKVIKKVAPKTTLNLTLQGVLSANDQAIARAIIKSGNGKPSLYSVGDKIKGANVSIEEIKIGEVLLNRNGAIESLPIVKLKGGKGDNSVISYASRTTSDTSTARYVNNTNASTRSAPRRRAASGEPRKVKKPNFSGLDRALQKMGEI